MLSAKPINSFQPSGISMLPDSRAAGFDRQLAITKADALLKTTRQYQRWQTIRNSDPAKADHVARIILERHAFLEGKSPVDAGGRRHFDRLTERLQAAGIYLYKSHQFKQPIFKRNGCAENRYTTGQVSPQAPSDPAETVMLKNLRDRFKNRDCLEFLANLLEDNGIAYYGKQGLAHRLIGQARSQGKNLNAYLTCEGLTRELSSKPVTLSLKKGHGRSFENVWQQLRPHIQPGSILSFSSKSFGHTGLVDGDDKRWVYFNSSGTVGKPESYQIKAEDVKLEIKSWFQRAKQQDTFLNITVGTIDPNLAARFHNTPKKIQHAPSSTIDLLASHRAESRSSAV